MAGTAACRSRLARLEEELDGRTLLVRSDRVELSKNLIRGFLAFDELLESSAQWRGRLVFLARVYSSRESLPEYLAYRTEVQHVVARVNQRWGAPGYTPVVLDLEDDFAGTVAALRRYDMLLVNPVRDGLNLVAMEGPAVNERDGVVVLSREAGAHDELADVAIGINPFDVTGTAAAMARGLSMSRAEREDRAAELRRRARSRTPADWLAELRRVREGSRRRGYGYLESAGSLGLVKSSCQSDQEADCSARPVEDEVGRVDKASGRIGPGHRDLHRLDPGGCPERVERLVRGKIPVIVAEIRGPLQVTAQLGDYSPLVDTERRYEFHARLARSGQKAVLGSHAEDDFFGTSHNRLQIAARGADRAPMGRDPVLLVLDQDAGGQGGPELISGSRDHRAPGHHPGA